MSEPSRKQSQALSQSNDKLNEAQSGQLSAKNRPRPAPIAKDKDEAKKKRKLLSFGEEFEEVSPDKREAIKRPQNQKSKKKFELTKHINKQTLQEQLRAEFLQKIEKLKQQMFEIDFSYWDGPQVIKKLKKKKKETVISLLQFCRLQLIANFQSLAAYKTNELLMVIKDCILPHKITIAEVEALEMKTAKEDLLLNFKNVKIKDLSLSVNMDGPVRIIEKAKYEKNIAAYPFNTWREINVD